MDEYSVVLEASKYLIVATRIAGTLLGAYPKQSFIALVSVTMKDEST